MRRLAEERIGELEAAGRPPHEPADFATWYELEKMPNDTQGWVGSVWGRAIEAAREDRFSEEGMGRYYRKELTVD